MSSTNRPSSQMYDLRVARALTEGSREQPVLNSSSLTWTRFDWIDRYTNKLVFIAFTVREKEGISDHFSAEVIEGMGDHFFLHLTDKRSYIIPKFCLIFGVDTLTLLFLAPPWHKDCMTENDWVLSNSHCMRPCKMHRIFSGRLEAWIQCGCSLKTIFTVQTDSS